MIEILTNQPQNTALEHDVWTGLLWFHPSTKPEDLILNEVQPSIISPAVNTPDIYLSLPCIFQGVHSCIALWYERTPWPLVCKRTIPTYGTRLIKKSLNFFSSHNGNSSYKMVSWQGLASINLSGI
jgi:hypothetical protein